MSTDTGAEQAATLAAKAATYGGAGASALGGFFVSSEGLALLGLLVAIAGFGVNLWLGLRRDQREAREHSARMKSLE